MKKNLEEQLSKFIKKPSFNPRKLPKLTDKELLIIAKAHYYDHVSYRNIGKALGIKNAEPYSIKSAVQNFLIRKGLETLDFNNN